MQCRNRCITPFQEADLIFGIGCNFATSSFAAAMPAGKAIIHATAYPADLNNNVTFEEALLGDATLILKALIAAVKPRFSRESRNIRTVSGSIEDVKKRRLDEPALRDVFADLEVGISKF